MNRHMHRAQHSLRDGHTPSEENGGNLPVSRERLQRLLAQAREIHAAHGGIAELQAHPALCGAIAPYAREDNLDRVEVYQAPLGGYHADVVFRTTPLGIPDAVGTAAGHPAHTSEEAELRAMTILRGILDLDHLQDSQGADGHAVFMFFGRPIRIPTSDLAELAALPGYRPLTKAEAVSKFDQALRSPLLIEGDDNLRAMKFEQLWMMEALIAGVMRYPMSVDRAPSRGPSSRLH